MEKLELDGLLEILDGWLPCIYTQHGAIPITAELLESFAGKVIKLTIEEDERWQV